jgi:hypothetical protein
VLSPEPIAVAWIGFVHLHETSGIRIWQRAQQDAADEAENRGVRANAERECPMVVELSVEVQGIEVRAVLVIPVHEAKGDGMVRSCPKRCSDRFGS